MTSPEHDAVAPLRIAMIGTRGVPAAYGGFETAVEEIGARLATRGHEVTVYCRHPAKRRRSRIPRHAPRAPPGTSAQGRRDTQPCGVVGRPRHHAPPLGCRRSSSMRRTPRSFPCCAPAASRPQYTSTDSNGSATNGAGRAGGTTAGLRRSPCAGRMPSSRMPRASPTITTANSPCGPNSSPTARRSWTTRRIRESPSWASIPVPITWSSPGSNPRTTSTSFSTATGEAPRGIPSWSSAPLRTPPRTRSGSIRSRPTEPRIRLLGPVWDQELLDQLYAHARSYLHGHSVGGTNPSLLRAMGAGTAVIAWNVVFNREVAGPAATYFDDAASLGPLVEDTEFSTQHTAEVGESLRNRAASRYDWDAVATGYERLAARLIGGYSTRGRGHPRTKRSAWSAVAPDRGSVRALSRRALR